MYTKVRVKDVAEINPSKPTNFKELSPDFKVSFFPMSSVSENGKIVTPEVRSLGEVNKGYTYFEENDILLAKITPCMENGKRAIAKNLVNGTGFGSTEFHVLRPKQAMLSTYLFHIIGSDIFRKEAKANMTGSAGQKRVPASFVKEYSIPLPSLETQKKIADVLDKSQELIDKRKSQIEKLDEFVQSVFFDMFGDPISQQKWNVEAVGNACKCIVPGRDKPKSFSGNIPWITTDDLKLNGVTEKSKKYLGLNENEIKNVKAKIIPKGSVLMSCVGNLGITSIAGVDLVINQQLHSFQCGDRIDNRFLCYLLSLNVPYMKKMATETTVLYMNKTVCNSIPIIVPPLELQRKFALVVEQTEQQKSLMQQSLAEMENNFNSIMQRAFRGELF